MQNKLSCKCKLDGICIRIKFALAIFMRLRCSLKVFNLMPEVLYNNLVANIF